MVRTNSLALGLVLASGLHLGCVPEAPAPAIACHVGPRQSLLRLHRVVLVALQSDENDSAIGDEMTQALFQAVQERKLFHLRVVRRTDPQYRDLPLHHTAVHAGRACRHAESAGLQRRSVGLDPALSAVSADEDGAVPAFDGSQARQAGLGG